MSTHRRSVSARDASMLLERTKLHRGSVPHTQGPPPLRPAKSNPEKLRSALEGYKAHFHGQEGWDASESIPARASHSASSILEYRDAKKITMHRSTPSPPPDISARSTEIQSLPIPIRPHGSPDNDQQRKISSCLSPSPSPNRLSPLLPPKKRSSMDTLNEVLPKHGFAYDKTSSAGRLDKSLFVEQAEEEDASDEDIESIYIEVPHKMPERSPVTPRKKSDPVQFMFDGLAVQLDLSSFVDFTDAPHYLQTIAPGQGRQTVPH